MTSVKEKVLQLAQQGLAVFPCLDAPGTAEDKSPATRNGFYNATADPEDVELWIWEGRLIGTPTGPVNGFAVLEIDPRHNGDVWLKANINRLNRQGVPRSHRTRSRGLHLLFKASDGAIRNSASKIAPGVDVRGAGGYVIWWPAHPPDGCVLDDVPLIELPEWPAWLAPEEPAPERIRSGPVLANRHRVIGLLHFMRESRDGERNNRLYWTACRLAEMRFRDPEQRLNAVHKLHDIAVAAGLDPVEAEKTITSAFKG